MLVQNRREVEARTCACGTWLRHWERGAGLRARYCAATRCFRTADVGGRIVRSGSIDRGEYIVPLCAFCHEQEGAFEINAILVPATTQVYCGLARGPSPAAPGAPRLTP